MKRRTFVKNSSQVTAAFAILSSSQIFSQDRPVDVDFIGVGLRGQSNVDLSLQRKDVNIVAICDIDDRMLKSTLDLISKRGKPAPKIFTGY